MNFRSVQNMTDIIVRNLDRIGSHYSAVVAVPRSGLLPATLISLYKNLPLYSSTAAFASGEHGFGSTRSPRFLDGPVLLVDDSVNTGQSINSAVSTLRSGTASVEVETMAVYASNRSPSHVDWFLEYVPFPRFFEWNLFHHPRIGEVGFDLDGVFCADPPDRFSDDPVATSGYYRSAKAMVVPTGRVGAILSSRLETYRPETESWLELHGFEYQTLRLLHGTADARRSLRLHADFKATEYANSDLQLFVESDPSQAFEIQRLTGKPVVCWSANRRLLPGRRSRRELGRFRSEIRGVRRLLRRRLART